MGTDIKMTPYLDCGAALMNLCNGATALGLSASWLNFSLTNIGKARHVRLRNLLKIPSNLIPVSLVGIGIPNKDIKKPPRENVKFYLTK